MIGEQVTILRPGPSTTDRYGNEVPGPDVATIIENCLVGARTQSDRDLTDMGRTGVVIGLIVIFPAGTDVRATDRLTIRGETHEIEGDPFAWQSASSGTGRGVHVATRRVEG